MDTAEREVQIRRFLDEVWNGRDCAARSRLYHEDHMSPYGKGPEAKAAGSRANHLAFPVEMDVAIDDLVVSGDKTVLRLNPQSRLFRWSRAVPPSSSLAVVVGLY